MSYFSDYGSGSSSNSSSSWLQDSWPSSKYTSMERTEQKSASFQDLVMGKCTLEDIMKEFQMNGTDSPYNPVDDKVWSNHSESLVGMGPGSAYVRQRSWPAPERSPAPRLLRPRDWLANNTDFSALEFTSSTPVDEITSVPPAANISTPPADSFLTGEQLAVLNSLPNTVLFSLLHDLEHTRDALKRTTRRQPTECRFCKNNGERESYYRSHALKDGAGRVACPVLRAFVCKRCGARGDSAHTIKYCPLSTADERMKSAAMMRSVRLASGRRRSSLSPASAHEQFVVFGDTTPSMVADNHAYNSYAITTPLDPSWAALEQKLML